MANIERQVPIITTSYFILRNNDDTEYENYIEFTHPFSVSDLNNENTIISFLIKDATTGSLFYEGGSQTKDPPFKIDTLHSGKGIIKFKLSDLAGVDMNGSGRDTFYSQYANFQFNVQITITFKNEDATIKKSSPAVLIKTIYQPKISVELVKNDSRQNLTGGITINALDILLPDSDYKFEISYNSNSYDDTTIKDSDCFSVINYMLIKKEEGAQSKILQQEEVYFKAAENIYTKTLNLDLMTEALLDAFKDSNTIENINMDLELRVSFKTRKGYAYNNYTLNNEGDIISITGDTTSDLFNNTMYLKQKLKVTTHAEQGKISIQAQLVPKNENGLIDIQGNALLFRKEVYGDSNWKLLKKQQKKITSTNWSEEEGKKVYNLSFDDFLTEDGKFYTYGVLFYTQGIEEESWKYRYLNTIASSENPSTLLIEDIFLLSANNILKIAYNTSISNFKYNVAEQVTTTIGKKYPYVIKNGRQFYRSFNISGLISYHAELDDLYNETQISDSVKQASVIHDPFQNSQFISLDELQKDRYKDFSMAQQEVILERKFREKVMEFLLGNNVFLFKSAQEGNIVVRLTQISFTPNQQLGRNIYSFSAMAIEVEDNSVETLYKLFNVSNYNQNMINLNYPTLFAFESSYTMTMNNINNNNMIATALRDEANGIYGSLELKDGAYYLVAYINN